MSEHKLDPKQIFNERLTTLGQLTAGVAHELNNPAGYLLTNLATFEHYMSLIKNYCQVLQQLAAHGDQPQLQQQLAQLQQQANLDYVLQDCDQLIADSLEGANRIKTLLLELRRFALPLQQEAETVDVRALLTSCQRLLKHELKPHQVSCELPDAPLWLHAVSHQLQQVLLNLLLNACQALGSSKGQIHIQGQCVGQRVYLRIDDSGPGVALELQERIFEPFVTTKSTGNGLGLSICRQLVRQAGGELSLIPSQLGGACFELSLPAATRDDVFAAGD